MRQDTEWWQAVGVCGAPEGGQGEPCATLDVPPTPHPSPPNPPSTSLPPPIHFPPTPHPRPPPQPFLYRLQDLSTEGDPGASAFYQQLWSSLQARHPRHLPLLLERLRRQVAAAAKAAAPAAGAAGSTAGGSNGGSGGAGEEAGAAAAEALRAVVAAAEEVGCGGSGVWRQWGGGSVLGGPLSPVPSAVPTPAPPLPMWVSIDCCADVAWPFLSLSPPRLLLSLSRPPPPPAGAPQVESAIDGDELAIYLAQKCPEEGAGTAQRKKGGHCLPPPLAPHRSRSSSSPAPAGCAATVCGHRLPPSPSHSQRHRLPSAVPEPQTGSLDGPASTPPSPGPCPRHCPRRGILSSQPCPLRRGVLSVRRCPFSPLLHVPPPSPPPP